MGHLDLYEEMLASSKLMLEAAEAREWDRLVEEEIRYAAMSAQVMRLPDIAPGDPDIPRIEALLRELLEKDARIRQLVREQLDEMQNFLGSRQRERKLTRAYDFPA